MKVSLDIAYIVIDLTITIDLQVEWAKSRARTRRWDEEVELVVEEMRRVLCYMDWRSQYWQSLVSKREVLDSTVREGIAAYASKQVYIAQMMAHRFSKQWLPVLEGNSIAPDWPVHYTSHKESSIPDASPAK